MEIYVSEFVESVSRSATSQFSSIEREKEKEKIRSSSKGSSEDISDIKGNWIQSPV